LLAKMGNGLEKSTCVKGLRIFLPLLLEVLQKATTFPLHECADCHHRNSSASQIFIHVPQIGGQNFLCLSLPESIHCDTHLENGEQPRWKEGLEDLHCAGLGLRRWVCVQLPCQVDDGIIPDEADSDKGRRGGGDR